MEFLKHIKDWPQDPISWYKQLVSHKVPYSALSVLCPYTIIPVPDAKFISPVTARIMHQYQSSNNETDKCPYLTWLFANIDETQYAFVYSDEYTKLASAPYLVWSVKLRGIMFKDEADAVMFKLNCGDMLV